jgi:hypothetical protein
MRVTRRIAPFTVGLTCAIVCLGPVDVVEQVRARLKPLLGI